MKAVSAISYWLKYHTNVIQPNYVRGDYRRNSLLDKVINETRSFARRLYLKHIDFFDPVNYDNKFVFFPLHLQPEASTLILAPMFLNQIALVQQVARSLPINYKLYVKPNPNMFGWRDIQYYNKLKDISGVRLIHPLNDSHELIRQSELVTTITGTAGLEAALYRKPVVTFGSVNYNMMDMIYNCNDVQSLSRILFDGINEYTHNEQELHQYMTAVFQNSISLNSLFDVSEDAIENDAEKILSMVVEHI
jgi:capsule polysaccharide modification protein KpsS